MRLKIDDENTQYTWHVQDPKIQELFEKQLSKHSVGAYVTLTDEVGRSFWAIHRHTEGPDIGFHAANIEMFFQTLIT